MFAATDEASKDDCVSDDAIYKLPILLHSWDQQGPLPGRRRCSIVVLRRNALNPEEDDSLTKDIIR